MLQVKQLRLERWFSYVAYDETSRQAVIVDPLYGLCDMIELMLEDAELELRAIVETQCHWQRVSGAGRLRESLGVPCLMPAASGSASASSALSDGDAITLGDHRLVVRAAPGVAPDALVLVADRFALTGNTLLVEGSGALGLPGSCAEALFGSLRRVFDGLAGDLLIYPAQDCHGRLFSTLGRERAQATDLTVEQRELFVSRKRRAQALTSSPALQRIYDENRALRSDWDTDPATGLPCSCLSPHAYLRDAQRPPVPEIHARDAHRRSAAGMPLVDVREGFELLVGEVPGAVHMPVSELGMRLSELAPIDTLVMCAHGNRSAWVAATLMRLGIPSINVAGGLSAWRAAGLAVA